MTNIEIADTILHQLGGNRFVAMTGAKNFLAIDDGIRMTLPRNGSKANRLEITLNGADLYDMRFYNYKQGGWKVNHKTQTCTVVEDKLTEVAEYHDVYCDQLEELFTQTTKMYTRL